MAPTKTKQRSESWINDAILRAIRLRNASYVEFKQSNNQLRFKNLRNEVNRMVTKAKSELFSKKSFGSALRIWVTVHN